MKTCMRYLAVVFAVAMIICSLSSVSAAFPDVAGDNKYGSAISTMTNLGIIGGYEDGTFRPDGLVTRAEMAKIVFVSYTTYTDAGEGALTFPDVSEKYWAKGYISWCAGKNIVGGYEDGTFRPTENITYDEALKMVCAMLGYKDFDPEQWPIDVRVKGLNDLKLGKNLEGIAGDAALTRAQTVQLIYNSLDKPTYQETSGDPVDGPLGSFGFVTVKPGSSLKDDIWAIEEVTAQIVATEKYGFVDLEENIKTKKTDDEELIGVRFTYDDGTYEDKIINLSDIGLDSYIGNSDGLITLQINIIMKKGTDEFVSAELKGTVKEGITGGYASTTGLSEDEKIYNGSDPYARFGVQVDGVNYYNEHFLNLRRLTYYDDFVMSTNPHVDGAGNIVNQFRLLYSWQTNHNRWAESTFSLTQGFGKVMNAIDSDSDGWYDYLIIEWKELFRVKNITSKTIEFEYLHKNQNANWKPVPDYVHRGNVNAGTVVNGLDLVFPKENVTVISPLEEGMIVQGYQMGDKFYVSADASISTGYITKYDASNYKFTIDSGKTLGGDYCSWRVWDSHSYAPSMINSFVSSMEPLIGINGLTGNYNYGKFWTIEDKIIWVEKLPDELVGGTGAGYKKAILQYVTEPTEPQLNEATKEHEVFYPAYLLIDGRQILVNLDADNAINGFSAESVTQNGSPYRATVIDDNGVNRIMYANMLVTYSVNEDGYYSLQTESQTITDVNDEIVEMVIDNGDKIAIEKESGILSILAADGSVIQSRIKVEDGSIIYYPYTKEATGAHEYIDFYRGDEIPDDFEEAEINGNVFLTYDKEAGLWTLGALLIKGKLDGTGAVKTDYTKDAREHLFAVLDSEAVIDGDKVVASYAFKNLFTFEDVTGINKSQEYDDATEVTAGSIYAWDADDKNYVEVKDTFECVLANEVIDEIFADTNVIFSTTFASGAKLDDTVKVIAVTDKETATIENVGIEGLVTVFDTIKVYNEANADEVGFTAAELKATIGTYADENNKAQIAYILIDWVEYDDEANKLIIADKAE